MEFIYNLNWLGVMQYIAYCWMVISIFIIFYLLKILKQKNFKYEIMQQQNIAKIDGIRREHLKSLESLRIEMIKRNDERNRQWAESEKETLHVLNGVSNLLDLGEKIGRVDAEKILIRLDEIQNKMSNGESDKILDKLEEIQIKLEMFINDK